MQKNGTCNFCGTNDCSFEGKYCSIECADLYESMLWWAPRMSLRGYKFTAAQEDAIERRLSRNGVFLNDLMEEVVRKEPQYTQVA